MSVLPANTQDCDGAPRSIARGASAISFHRTHLRRCPLSRAENGGAYGLDGRGWTIEIVKRSDANRFVVLPKRWIMERTFAWSSRNRRLPRYAMSVAAFLRLAMIRIMQNVSPSQTADHESVLLESALRRRTVPTPRCKLRNHRWLWCRRITHGAPGTPETPNAGKAGFGRRKDRVRTQSGFSRLVHGGARPRRRRSQR
jgi:hypothetical protein